MATSAKLSKWVPADGSKSSNSVVIQPFTFPDAAWLGSSFVIGEFRYLANIEFVFPTQIIPPPGSNYLLAVRYNNVKTGFLVRYKLYSHKDADMHYPLYNGEVIAEEFAIEIWCVKDHAAVNVTSWEIKTGILNLQVECCGCTLGNEEIDPNIDPAVSFKLFGTILPYGQQGVPVVPPPANLIVFDQPFTP